jgi:hypothetical protein
LYSRDVRRLPSEHATDSPTPDSFSLSTRQRAIAALQQVTHRLFDAQGKSSPQTVFIYREQVGGRNSAKPIDTLGQWDVVTQSGIVRQFAARQQDLLRPYAFLTCGAILTISQVLPTRAQEFVNDRFSGDFQ